MIRFNLATPGKSGAAFKIIQFSDTEELLTLEDPRMFYAEDVQISSRMSWKDLQIIIQAVKILKGLKVNSISLLIPYLLGARSDRKFNAGSLNYIKEVIAPILNSLELDDVTVHDPHSLAAECCINKLVSVSTLPNLLTLCRRQYELGVKDFEIVCPDEGAIKRTMELAKVRGKDPILCIKDRDILTGNILGVKVLADDLGGKACIITDDICDGGATFLALGEALKAKNAGDLYLCVTHGIFSKGFDELKKYFKGIITTNSVREFTKEEEKYVTTQRVL